MKQPDAFLQSLHGLDQPPELMGVDISARVIQTIHDRASASPPLPAMLPTVATLACVIALAAVALAVSSYSSAADPISSLVSPLNVSLQW